MSSKHLLEKTCQRKATVAVIGLGYVGLPTAVFFAEQGFRVVGADNSQEVVEKLSRGESHIDESNLPHRVREVVDKGLFSVTSSTSKAAEEADCILVVVPTPVTKDKRPDLGPVIQAGKDISMGLKSGSLVVLESTVYPGVTENILRPELEKSGLKAGKDFGLAYCPERYNPGDEEHSIDNVNRIVGGITPEWTEVARELYQSICNMSVVAVRDIKTAEAAKVIENTQRDLNIALMNELALIFDKMGLDVNEIIDAASTKWNFNVYRPGPGVGGHCLPVDPYYLVKKAEEMGYHSKVITAGRAVNDFMPEHMFDLLSDALNEYERAVKNSKIVVLGLSYKDNVGDLRESPTMPFLEILKTKKADIVVVEPLVSQEKVRRYAPCSEDVYDAAKDADAIVLFTAHTQFHDMDVRRLRGIMRTPIFVDGKRLYDPEKLKALGFRYRGVGAGRANNERL